MRSTYTTVVHCGKSPIIRDSMENYSIYNMAMGILHQKNEKNPSGKLLMWTGKLHYNVICNGMLYNILPQLCSNLWHSRGAAQRWQKHQYRKMVICAHLSPVVSARRPNCAVFRSLDGELLLWAASPSVCYPPLVSITGGPSMPFFIKFSSIVCSGGRKIG